METLRDGAGNVLIRKPATPGMEGRKTVILQSHLDMVPQKNSSVKHDFLTDPIDAYIDGDWVTARETTLGTDYANLKMVDELNVEEYGVAFRKDSDVAEAVDNAFDELKADGTMQTLADKYGLTLAE